MSFIQVSGLVKIYRPKGSDPVHALDGVDLEVRQGTVRALLGPNGAGKTTMVKVLTTLARPDAGGAMIDGIDVLRDAHRIRSIIGASGQYAAVDENLTGLENLDMVGRLYHFSAKETKRRAQELIEAFELGEAQNRPVKGFSGGMRRRIDLASAIFSRPRVLFLDEPTTGLDPRSRLGMWEVITGLVGEGTTVLLTTQYLEEADRLADEISVIDGGKLIAEGKADELKASIGGQQIELTLIDAGDRESTTQILQRHGTSAVRENNDGRSLSVAVNEGPLSLELVLRELNAGGIRLHDAGMRRPTLDDVFLKLTGHTATTEDESVDGDAKQHSEARS